jgi:anti-anti-sigma factor
METSFTTRVEPSGDSVVVHVGGDMDVATCDQFREEVSPLVDTGSDVVIDLAEVPFMDSVGISAILATRRALLAHGGSLTVRSPSGAVHRLLDLTGVAELLMGSTQQD